MSKLELTELGPLGLPIELDGKHPFILLDRVRGFFSLFQADGHFIRLESKLDIVFGGAVFIGRVASETNRTGSVALAVFAVALEGKLYLLRVVGSQTALWCHTTMEKDSKHTLDFVPEKIGRYDFMALTIDGKTRSLGTQSSCR